MRALAVVGLVVVACGGHATRSAQPDASTGGSGGSGGQATTNCGTSVTLRVTADVSGPAYCIGRPSSCDATWLTISNATGEAVATALACGATPCASCQSMGCTFDCPISTRLPDAGLDWSWDGTTWIDGSTCGSGVACARPTCTPAGHYVAHLCGYALLSGDGGVLECESGAATTPTCVDVPFDVPGVIVANGVLGAP